MAREGDIVIERDYQKKMAKNLSSLEKAGDSYDRAVKRASTSTRTMEEKLSTSTSSLEIGVLSFVGGLRELIDLSDGIIRAIQVATAGIGVASALIGIYAAWAAAKSASATAQWTAALFETVATALAGRVDLIAGAVLALAVFGAAFYGAHAIGVSVAVPAPPTVVDGGTIDLSDPASRRRITGVIAGGS